MGTWTSTMIRSEEESCVYDGTNFLLLSIPTVFGVCLH